MKKIKTYKLGEIIKSKKICLFGCPGSGKSTLGKNLSKIMNLQVYHLDNIYWKPNWVNISKEEFDEKLNELQRYLNKRKETMKRYKDYDGVKQKLKTYSKKTGLKYRNMGCQESNNYCKLTRRMKKKRMSWSKNGSENIAKVITMYASESCTNIIKHLNIQILPEGYVEYAQKYIEEIENNIKELKKNKVKTKKIYTFKQGSLEGYPNLKKILENKEISELIYR